MARVVYDMVKLDMVDEIDVRCALQCFDSFQTYFDGLNKFVDMSKTYFCEYNPTVVICNDEMREDFLAEVEKIKCEVLSLGISSLTSELSDLECVTGDNSVSALTNCLKRFSQKTEQVVNLIASARIVIDEGGKQTLIKPLILAVDDKPELLTAIANMLRDEFTVMAVTSGKATLKILEKHTPKLFLLDIEMPEINGYQLAKIIRGYKAFENAPIIFLTGKGSRSDVIEAIKNGGNDYIVKPVEKEVLIDRVKKYLK